MIANLRCDFTTFIVHSDIECITHRISACSPSHSIEIINKSFPKASGFHKNSTGLSAGGINGASDVPTPSKRNPRSRVSSARLEPRPDPITLPRIHVRVLGVLRRSPRNLRISGKDEDQQSQDVWRGRSRMADAGI